MCGLYYMYKSVKLIFLGLFSLANYLLFLQITIVRSLQIELYPMWLIKKKFTFENCLYLHIIISKFLFLVDYIPLSYFISIFQK